MSSFQNVVEAANAAWLANYTVGDERWRLRQLHGLHQFVIDNREDIVSSLAKVSGQPTILYEREIALFVAELQNHISKLQKKHPSPCVSLSIFGQIAIVERPRGVSLILCNSQNFVRYGLAPLAASIAANNVAILGTSTEHDNEFVSLLNQKWNKYLSTETAFFLPGIKSVDIDVGRIDHIAILDSTPATYSTVLQSPKAHFYSVVTGYNIAIVDEGKKDWITIAQQILESSTDNKLPSDRLSLVFIRTEDLSDFRSALKVQWTAEKKSTDSKVPHVTDCTFWGKNIFSLNSTSAEGFRDATDSSLEAKLRRTQSVGALLVVTVTSLDKAVDLVNGLSSPIQQLALLAPGSKKVEKYVSTWINAHIFSTGSIRPVLPPSFDTFVSSESLKFIFPTTLFSRPQIIAEEKSVPLPSSVPAIRASYEKLIPPLKPEPRGERIGFFTQAEYLVKGVASTAAILAVTGLYFGVKALKKRYV